jgi:CRISPR/Cas system Type II protein with McrA/HNH and RuvC-like nuclease domain
MTAMLRAKFGLSDVLGLNGEKNRNYHRRHAVDACVIAVADQGFPTHIAAKIAALAELYPQKNRTQIVSDLLTAAIDDLEKNLPQELTPTTS